MQAVLGDRHFAGLPKSAKGEAVLLDMATWEDRPESLVTVAFTEGSLGRWALSVTQNLSVIICGPQECVAQQQ